MELVKAMVLQGQLLLNIGGLEVENMGTFKRVFECACSTRVACRDTQNKTHTQKKIPWALGTCGAICKLEQNTAG